MRLRAYELAEGVTINKRKLLIEKEYKYPEEHSFMSYPRCGNILAVFVPLHLQLHACVFAPIEKKTSLLEMW